MNMTTKKMDVLVLVGLLGVDCWYLYKAFSAPIYKMVFVSPYEFPKLIGAGLALLCCIALAKTLQRNSQEEPGFTIPNLRMVLVTVGATCAFVLLWKMLGLFYLWGTLYVLFLLFAYRKEGGRFSRKNILMNVAVAIGILLGVYLMFGLIMGLRL